jgi:hypothetical protein
MQDDRNAPSRHFCRRAIIRQQGHAFGWGRTFTMWAKT